MHEAIAYCKSRSDFVSRDLFAEIPSSEEELLGWLETQLGMIEKMGVESDLHSSA